jgi:hypothetical protein
MGIDRFKSSLIPSTPLAAHELEDQAKAEVVLETPAVPSDTTSSGHQRRRFSHFAFRRHTTSRSVAGPALAVIDNDPNTTSNETKRDKEKDGLGGVRVIIRLAALDEQGTELMSPNEQTTFLHIVRLLPNPLAKTPMPTIASRGLSRL